MPKQHHYNSTTLKQSPFLPSSVTTHLQIAKFPNFYKPKFSQQSPKFSNTQNRESSMGKGSKVPKCLKICCGITGLIIIIFLVVSIALYFTILKPKEPKITTQSVFLEDIKLVPFPFVLNVTLGIVVTINNRNYESFKYKNSTTYVTYRGTLAAEGPVREDTIPARGKLDVGTTVVIQGEKLVLNPSFWTDYFSGCLNFTSSTTLHGKAAMLKFFKIKATTSSTCDISVFVQSMNATSVCSSSVKY